MVSSLDFTFRVFLFFSLHPKGIHPNDIKGIKDLQLLPFTKKEDLRNNYPYKMFATPMEDIRRIHASSGTTGKPTVVGYTQNDLDVFDEVVARSLVCAGARPGMKLHNAYGYGLFTGGLGMHGGATKLGMAVIPVSGGMTDRQLTILQDFTPEVICCTPSYAQTLAEEFHKRGIDTNNLAVKYAVLGAEPWTETIRKQVEQGLNVSATNIYGLSEIIGPGVSQEDFEQNMALLRKLNLCTSSIGFFRLVAAHIQSVLEKRQNGWSCKPPCHDKTWIW